MTNAITRQPWNVSFVDSDLHAAELERDTLAQWEQMRPGDFYFATTDSSEGNRQQTTVYLVPVEFFEEHGRMITQSMPIGHIVPRYLIEEYESTYVGRFSQESVRADLQQRGFVPGLKFDSYIRSAMDLDECFEAYRGAL